MNGNSDKRRSVAIIGAGPAGLVVAQKFLEKKELFKITVFDKLSDVGGTWIYSENTDTDKYGLPVQSSVYRNLRTNLPTALMEFDDYPHNKNPTGFISHQQVLQYLQDFSDHFGIKKYTKLLHLVTKISRDSDSWLVHYRNLETKETFIEIYDIVCLCQGRFSLPYLPNDISGLDKFKGLVMHTHTYRIPDVFKNKKVAILGGGPSGIDIALEVGDFARETFLCYIPNQIGKKHPLGNKITQPGAIFKSIDEHSIELTNGTVLPDIDAIIFATGYQIDFDIIDPSCGITGGEGRIDGLFMHMININYPTMAFFGLMEKIPPFNFFCQMAKYYVRTLSGESKLLSKEEMIKDLKEDRDERQSMNLKLKHSHRMFSDQMWRYDKKISDLGGFEALPSLTKALYDECYALRWRETDYKDYEFVLHNDGETFTIVKTSV